MPWPGIPRFVAPYQGWAGLPPVETFSAMQHRCVARPAPPGMRLPGSGGRGCPTGAHLALPPVPVGVPVSGRTPRERRAGRCESFPAGWRSTHGPGHTALPAPPAAARDRRRKQTAGGPGSGPRKCSPPAPAAASGCPPALRPSWLPPPPPRGLRAPRAVPARRQPFPVPAHVRC